MCNKRINRRTVEKMYIDYFNNFCTVYRFAEHYEIDEETATRIINLGRKLNHLR
jgi:hypothetical protein